VTYRYSKSHTTLFRKMVWKLLRTNINSWQIAAYAAANLIGLLIAGLALQLYKDVVPTQDSGNTDPLGAARYTVVSRPARTTIFGGTTDGISNEEIEEISRQPWADGAAAFIPSGFDVTVGLSFAGRGFSTALFFEGVPDEYLDVRPQGWEFDPLNPEVAIILPRDYLALYNFGFAPARGLPPLDEQTVAMAPLKVTVSGNGLSRVFPGRIVGFSSRLNTIAVPEEFVRWANDQFSPGSSPSPSRAIIRIADPGNPEINRYLTSHDLEESSGGEATSRLCHFLRIVTGAVMAVGLLISLLSVGMLILSVFLLLQKSRPTLAGLINLGYSPRNLAGYYFRLICAVNLSVLVMSGVGTALAAEAWHGKLADLGMTCSSVWPTLLTMSCAMILLTLASGAVVNRVVRKIWHL